MGRRARVALTVALAGAAAVVLAVELRGPGTSQGPAVPPGPPPAKHEVSRPPRSAIAGWNGPIGARLKSRTQLRVAPGGTAVLTLPTKTEFGSPRVLAVVARRDGWAQVLTQFRIAHPGWIPESSVLLLREPYTITADVSARELIVRHIGRIVRRVRVAVGRPAEPTPLGRYAITDSLRLTGPSAYGCCALALTGRQPHIAQGWTGGDRIAIHGTSATASIGTAASGGCLRAGERDMRWMLKRIPLGAPVTIRA